MDAGLFFQSSEEGAIPLYLIAAEQWEHWFSSLSSKEQNCSTIKEFKGNLGDYCLIHQADGFIDKVFIGSGAGQQALALANAAALLPSGSYLLAETLNKEAAMQWALEQYRFMAFKKNKDQPRKLVVPAHELSDIIALTQAIFLVRDLINQPASHLGPEELATVVQQLAQDHQAQFSQWVGKELLQDNFPAIHAVGRASAKVPRLISLVWGKAHQPKITLVGKGVSFDSGGLDIKNAGGMRIMKKDMGGAAHVIGLAQWIMTRKLPVRLHVLIPAVENAIGPDAFRPGDVIVMRNGLSVEIDNTDAEGRLILADALALAVEEQPDLLIDFATLTGAARVAVGTEIAAVFTNSDPLAQELSASAQKTADPIWRLPLHAAYEDLLRSTVADLTNSCDSSYAGAIVAGLFLQRFIPPSIPWVHFDMMAWNVGRKPGKPEGGEAMGLRAMADYLLRTYG